MKIFADVLCFLFQHFLMPRSQITDQIPKYVKKLQMCAEPAFFWTQMLQKNKPMQD